MVERATIVDPFFRDLYDVLAPEIDKRMVELANGSARKIEGGIVTTAEAYLEQVATIAAYNEVLKVCEEIQLNRHGNKPPPESEGS